MLGAGAIQPVTARTAEESARLLNKYHIGHTPLTRLNFSPPDRPQGSLEIFLKLETVHPIGSFKIRGALNATVRKVEAAMGAVAAHSKKKKHIRLVTASAGNMGQGVAYAARLLEARSKNSGLQIRCIVIVPDHAPDTKLHAMRSRYGCDIVKVPFARWWEIICEAPGDISAELARLDDHGHEEDEKEEAQQIFIHPVCEQTVVDGHGSCGLEVVEQLRSLVQAEEEEEASSSVHFDAAFFPLGGGGFTCGFGSVLKELSGGRTQLYSCEPVTAAPMALSHATYRRWKKNLKEESGEAVAAPPAQIAETDTPAPDPCSYHEFYEPSWVDGCGGKTVLEPMWAVNRDVVTGAEAVDLDEIAFAVELLLDRNKVLAEGAGAIAVAAALFADNDDDNEDVPLQKRKRVLAVVCGGGLDLSVLQKILSQEILSPEFKEMQLRKTKQNTNGAGGEFKKLSLEERYLLLRERRAALRKTGGLLETYMARKKAQNAVVGQPSNANSDIAVEAVPSTFMNNHWSGELQRGSRVFSPQEVRELLTLPLCIESTEWALKAFSASHSSTGTSRVVMPVRQIVKLPMAKERLGFLGSMPSYLDGYAACKVIAVIPGNSNSRYSSHQGVVLLFACDVGEGDGGATGAEVVGEAGGGAVVGRSESERQALFPSEKGVHDVSDDDDGDGLHNGRLLCVADAHEVTKIRTAAASAVATKYLANNESGLILCLLGTGDQAESHLEAMLAVRGAQITKVKVWGRNPEKTMSFCEKHRRALQSQLNHANAIAIEACGSAELAVRDSDIICTVTASHNPVLQGSWLKPGAHINAVGACFPAFRELDSEAIRRCKGNIFYDSLASVLKESGDIGIPYANGELDDLIQTPELESGTSASSSSSTNSTTSGANGTKAVSVNNIKEQDQEAAMKEKERRLKDGGILAGEVGDVAAGRIPGRQNKRDITLFKSLGIALEDLTAAVALFKMAMVV